MTQGSLLSDACRAVRPSNWLLLGVPVLLTLLMVDRFLPDYEAAIVESSDLSVSLKRAQIHAEMASKYQSNLDENQVLHQRLLKKAFQAASPEQSASQLTQELARIFAAIYVQTEAPIQVSVQPSKMTTSMLEAIIIFNCVPQQLQALELQLLSLPQLVKVTSLDVRVVPDNVRASQQLQVKLTINAVHVTVAEPQAPNPSQKSTS